MHKPAQKILPKWRRILPKAMALLTFRDRNIPEVTWRRGEWMYNAFRAYELVFGRAYGKGGIGDTIRAESGAYVTGINGNEVVTRYFYTWEAFLCHIESVVRRFIKAPDFGFRFVPIPQIAPAGPAGFTLPRPIFSFAIAYVNGQGVTRTTVSSTQTISSYNTSTSDFIAVWASNYSGTSNPVTSVTFNGNAFTAMSGQGNYGGGVSVNPYYIIGQSGTANIVVNISGTKDMVTSVQTYSGCLQTASVDQAGSFSAAATTNVTTTATANCWIIGLVCSFGLDTHVTSPDTERIRTDANYASGDSNGVVATSSSVTFGGTTGGGNTGCSATEIAPGVASGPTNVKTWDGVTQSTGIKTYQGVALASTKSVNGVT